MSRRILGRIGCAAEFGDQILPITLAQLCSPITRMTVALLAAFLGARSVERRLKGLSILVRAQTCPSRSSSDALGVITFLLQGLAIITQLDNCCCLLADTLCDLPTVQNYFMIAPLLDAPQVARDVSDALVAAVLHQNLDQMESLEDSGPLFVVLFQNAPDMVENSVAIHGFIRCLSNLLEQGIHDSLRVFGGRLPQHAFQR